MRKTVFRMGLWIGGVLSAASLLPGVANDSRLADAMQQRNTPLVRTLLQQKAEPGQSAQSQD